MNNDEILSKADESYKNGEYGEAYRLYMKLGSRYRPKEKFNVCAEYLNFYVNVKDNPWDGYETVREYCDGNYEAAAQKNNIEAIRKIIEDKIQEHSRCPDDSMRADIAKEIEDKQNAAEKAAKLFYDNIGVCKDYDYTDRYKTRMQVAMDAIRKVYDEFSEKSEKEDVRIIKGYSETLISKVGGIENAISDLRNVLMAKLNEINSKMNEVDVKHSSEIEEMLRTIVNEYKNGSASILNQLESNQTNLEKVIAEASQKLAVQFEEKYDAINKIVNDDADNVFVDFRNVSEELRILITNWGTTEEKVGKSLTSVKSAMILMKMLSGNGNLGDDANYNFLSISATAAVELKLKELFYHNYIEWCERKYGEISQNYINWPSELLHYCKDNECYEVANDFTIGSLKYYAMSRDKDGNPKNDRRKLTEYVREVYGRTINDVMGIIDQLGKNIGMSHPDITNRVNRYSIIDFRNQSAHSHMVLADAKKCCEELLGFKDFENGEFKFKEAQEEDCLMKKLLQWNKQSCSNQSNANRSNNHSGNRNRSRRR